MKLSGLLRMASLLLIATRPLFVSSQHVDVSSIGDTVDDTLDNNNDQERVLKPLTVDAKATKGEKRNKNEKEKTIKNKKGKATKAMKSRREQDPACDEIKALEKENKIQCASDCSDNYFTCEKGIVVEKALGLGERCFENESVRTSEGKCVLRDMEDMVLSFKVMDGCPNYPELDQCSNTVVEGEPSYRGVRNVDGIYYWIDDVIVTILASDDIEESGEKGFKIFYTFRFAHDKEDNRTVTYVASTNFGTTKVVRWRQMDNIDGVERLEYNCVNTPPDPLTIFVETIVNKNPALFIINEEGEMQFQNVDGNDFYTTEIKVKAKEIGEDYLEMMRNKTEDGVFDPKTLISVLAENLGNSSEDLCLFDNGLCEEERQSDPVKRPAFMYDEVFIFKKTSFLESGYDFSSDIEKGFNETKIPEIQKLLADAVDERMCLHFFEQDYKSGGTDVYTPIFPRNRLGKVFPRTTDLFQLMFPEGQDLEEVDAARRRMEFDEKKEEWTKKSQEDFIGDAFKKLPDSVQLVSGFSDNLDADLKQKLLDLALGTGPGLPDSQLLLETFEETDRLLNRIYDITDEFEDGLISIFDLINNIESIRPIVNDIKILVKIVDFVLLAASIIPPLKSFIIPLRNAVSKVIDFLIKADMKLKEIETKTTVKARPKIEKFLIKTESTQEKIAKSVFANEALSTPVQLARNCPSVNSGAQRVNDFIAPGKDLVFGLIDDFVVFGELIKSLLSSIISPIDIFNTFFTEAKTIADEIKALDFLLNPIKKLLDTRVSLNIPGPFCSSQKTLNIPYPCGVNYCRACTFFGCVNWPCGVKFCTKRTVIYLPVWCKKFFSYTVGEILDGIQGVLDFVFKPLLLIVEGLLAAFKIDFSKFPIPGTSITIDQVFLSSPLEIAGEVADLNLPSPFKEIARVSVVIADAIDGGSFDSNFILPVLKVIPGFEQFQPICSSTDLE